MKELAWQEVNKRGIIKTSERNRDGTGLCIEWYQHIVYHYQFKSR